MRTVYVASKMKHADKWLKLRADGLKVVSTWIDGPVDKDDVGLFWERYVKEASEADCVLAYHEPGEEMKGALVEIGAALAHGRLVFMVGWPNHSWTQHQNVVICDTVDDALTLIALTENPTG